MQTQELIMNLDMGNGFLDMKAKAQVTKKNIR